MADFSEKWGTDVDTAVKLALDDLKLTIDDVDVTVLEEPSRGFFGIGSKLALVRVEKKKTTDIETVKVEKELNKDKKDFDRLRCTCSHGCRGFVQKDFRKGRRTRIRMYRLRVARRGQTAASQYGDRHKLSCRHPQSDP